MEHVRPIRHELERRGHHPLLFFFKRLEADDARLRSERKESSREGVAPIYFVEVPGWEDKDFDQRCAEWVAELRRRQHVDLRPWFHEGEQALPETEV